MLLDEVGAHLQANGFGTIGADLFIGGLLPAPGKINPSDPNSPTIPVDATALYENPGEPPVHVKGRQRPACELPRFQVLVRSNSYQRARERAERIYRLLDGYSGKIEGVDYGLIRALPSPFLLSRDEGGRPRIATNYRVIKEPSPLSQPP